MNRWMSIATLSACVASLVCLAAAGPVGAAPRTVEVTVPGRGEVVVELPQAPRGGTVDPVLLAAARSGVAGRSFPEEVSLRGGLAVVEVSFDRGEARQVAAEVRRLRGVVDGVLPGALLQAAVPLGGLSALGAHPAVQQVMAPAEPSSAEPVAPDRSDAAVLFAADDGEQVAKTGALAWHADGRLGQGVKVGIIDTFHGSFWAPAEAAGQVPAPAGTFCRDAGVACSVWTPAGGTSGGDHGVASAEVIHEMAPAAELYLAAAGTALDRVAAIDYFAGQGVTIVSHSASGIFDGPGDGTGVSAEVIEHAVSKGMLWVNSAGNAAGRNSVPGQYWRGTWSDSDNDEVLNFPTAGEALPFTCLFAKTGVRWDDWAALRTDYDVYVLDEALDVVASSVEDQSLAGAHAPPIEEAACPDEDGDGDERYYVTIEIFDAGDGTAGDVIEIRHRAGWVEDGHHVNPGTVNHSFSESASPGALSVGAVDPALGVAIGDYSSEGPTNDGRLKPDLSAPSCLRSFSFTSHSCYDGTSAATPVVSGAAALASAAGVANGPVALRTWLTAATVDRGPAGLDSIYGAGELQLPAPPQRPELPDDPIGDPVEERVEEAVDRTHLEPDRTAHPSCPAAKRSLAQAQRRVARALSALGRARGDRAKRKARRRLASAQSARAAAAKRKRRACAAVGGTR